VIRISPINIVSKSTNFAKRTSPRVRPVNEPPSQEKRPSRLNDKISLRKFRPFKMHFLHRIVFALTALSPLVSAEIPPEFLNAVTAASNASLLWGPYRSNLYFGVKPRLPNSLLTGLLWLNADDYKSFSGTARSQMPSQHGF